MTDEGIPQVARLLARAAGPHWGRIGPVSAAEHGGEAPGGRDDDVIGEGYAEQVRDLLHGVGQEHVLLGGLVVAVWQSIAV